MKNNCQIILNCLIGTLASYEAKHVAIPQQKSQRYPDLSFSKLLILLSWYSILLKTTGTGTAWNKYKVSMEIPVYADSRLY
jgi:hypothetical protein